MTTETKTPLRAVIDARFGGVLTKGQHEPDGQACALEAAHAAVGDPWSDNPGRWPDIRPLNDGPWSSDEARTKHMIPLMEAFWDWGDWPEARRIAVVTEIVIETVRTIIAELPGLPDGVRAACRSASTLEEAERMALAAAAALAAEAAAANGVLVTACRIGVSAAKA